MKPPSHLTLPILEEGEPISAWSDDESETVQAQRALDEWVEEVNRFLGGSPRASEPSGRGNETLRSKNRTSPKLTGPTRIPAQRAQKPKLSPTRLWLGNLTVGLQDASSSPTATRRSSGPLTPIPFRPYEPPKVTPPNIRNRGPLPPQKPPPTVPLPARPRAQDVPDDVSTDEEEGCQTPMLVPPSASLNFPEPARPIQRVHFPDEPVTPRPFLTKTAAPPCISHGRAPRLPTMS